MLRSGRMQIRISNPKSATISKHKPSQRYLKFRHLENPEFFFIKINKLKRLEIVRDNLSKWNGKNLWLNHVRVVFAIWISIFRIYFEPCHLDFGFGSVRTQETRIAGYEAPLDDCRPYFLILL